MKRFQIVDAIGRENDIYSVLFEADIDDERLLKVQADLSAAMNQPLTIVDTMTERTAETAKPLFKSDAEVSKWLKKHQRNIERATRSNRAQ